MVSFILWLVIATTLLNSRHIRVKHPERSQSTNSPPPPQFFGRRSLLLSSNQHPIKYKVLKTTEKRGTVFAKNFTGDKYFRARVTMDVGMAVGSPIGNVI